jgi:hypothetical protein
MPEIAGLPAGSSIASADEVAVSQSGTTRRLRSDFFAQVIQRANATINANWANYLELAPTVANYSPQTYLLTVSAWDVPNNNPFDKQVWLLSGAGGVYSATKIGGGTNMSVNIASGKIRISNTHATTNAVTYAELIRLRD